VYIIYDPPSAVSLSNMFIFTDDTKCFMIIKAYNNFKMICHHYHTGVLITTSPSLSLNLSSCIITTNLIQSTPLMEMPFLTLPVVKMLLLLNHTVYSYNFTVVYSICMNCLTYNFVYATHNNKVY